MFHGSSSSARRRLRGLPLFALLVLAFLLANAVWDLSFRDATTPIQHPSIVEFIYAKTSPKPPPDQNAKGLRNTIKKPYTPAWTPSRKVTVDNFPRAQVAQSADDLPPLNARLRPAPRETIDTTPLFISITRNWRLLQQCVVSYINAGWPAHLIYVVDNTGTMFSNINERLTPANPSYVNHTRLDMLGVNVMVTPTLFTFAQLQNYYLWNALAMGQPSYFWAHMDTMVLSLEGDVLVSFGGAPDEPFRSFYDRALDIKETLERPEYADQPWGAVFFKGDWLTLVNTKAYDAVGGWDTHIPYYKGDDDFYFRLTESGWPILKKVVGEILDAQALDDIEVFYRKQDGPEPTSQHDSHGADPERPLTSMEGAFGTRETSDLARPVVGHDGEHWADDEVASEQYAALRALAHRLETARHASWEERQSWHLQQRGGHGEPYYRHPVGQAIGIEALTKLGFDVYEAKWAVPERLDGPWVWSINREPGDAWQLKQRVLKPPGRQEEDKIGWGF